MRGVLIGFVTSLCVLSGVDTRAAERGERAVTAPADEQTLHPPAWLKPGTELVYRSGEVEIEKVETKAWEYDPGEVDRDALNDWAFMRVQHATPEALTVYAEAAKWGGPAKGFLTHKQSSQSMDGMSSMMMFVRPDRFDWLEAKAGSNDSSGDVAWTIGGKAYDAVAFSSADGQFVFDKTSGVMLEFGRRAGGGDGETKSRMRVLQLAHVRQTDLPWIGRPTPDWVKPGVTVRYRRTSWTKKPGRDAEPTDTERARLAVKVERIGPAGVEATMQTATGPTEGRGARAPQTAAAVLTPDDRFWVHPDAFAGLEAGQVLDRCPVRRRTIKVKSVDRDADGRGKLVVETRCRNQVLTETFDLASGALLDRVRFDRPIDQYHRLRFVGIDQPEPSEEPAP